MHIDPKIPVEPPDTEGVQSRRSAPRYGANNERVNRTLCPGSEALNMASYAHSIVGDTARETTPWRATQRAAWQTFANLEEREAGGARW
jgi:hypothetical protein